MGRETGDVAAGAAADRAAEFLLARRLLWRRRDRIPVSSRFMRIEHPIRFYDVAFAPVVMTGMGRARDPRCADALDLLESKRTADGGYPAEVHTARTSPDVTTRGTFADWGPGGVTRSNPWVSVDALRVLRGAGRWSPSPPTGTTRNTPSG